MSIFSSPNFLRNLLLLDAASCVGCGALQVFATGSASSMMGLAPGLLMETGVLLLVYACVVAFIATRNPVPRALVWLLVFGNLGWAVLCVGLLLSGAVHPTALGSGYVILQAVTVLLLADLQWFGLSASRGKHRLQGL